jgi:hypothetical protein
MEQLTGLGQGLFKLGTLGGFGAATYAAVFSPSAANVSTACATAAAFAIGSGFFNKRRDRRDTESTRADAVATSGATPSYFSSPSEAEPHEIGRVSENQTVPTIEVPSPRITIATLGETRKYGDAHNYIDAPRFWGGEREFFPHPTSSYTASSKRRGGFNVLLVVFVLAAAAGLIARFW